MDGFALYALVALLTVVAVAGVGFGLAGAGAGNAKTRMAVVAKPVASDGKGNEAKATAKKQKKRLSIRRRIEMAGLSITVRTFWMYSVGAATVAAVLALATGQGLMVSALTAFAVGLGLPRWALSYLTARREKAFTKEFATAIDVIVRSVRTGLPVNEALKVVASEIPDPVGSEFRTLTENLKVGVTMEDGLKRMYDRMPTAEVNFFAIVMTIQQKTGGNLSEALSNLSGLLRDRKRLQGKIRALSSEAKASAMIIGAMPPVVMMAVYLTTPDYIALLFTNQVGNLMLIGCAIWMGIGILMMKKMVNFKY